MPISTYVIRYIPLASESFTEKTKRIQASSRAEAEDKFGDIDDDCCIVGIRKVKEAAPIKKAPLASHEEALASALKGIA